MKVKSRGSRTKKIEFTINYIIVGVSDFSLQKFNLNIFVTEGLLKDSLPFGRKVEFTPKCTIVELMDIF